MTLEDWPVIQGWLTGRGLSVPKLPPTGFLVEGVGACFLTKTDSGVALLEAYVTNPDAAPEARSSAIDTLTARLIEEARDCGFTSLIALTVDKGLVARAVERHGFTYVGQKHGLYREL